MRQCPTCFADVEPASVSCPGCGQRFQSAAAAAHAASMERNAVGPRDGPIDVLPSPERRTTAWARPRRPVATREPSRARRGWIDRFLGWIGLTG